MDIDGLEQLLANAKGVGSFMGQVAAEAAALLNTVREAKADLDAGDVDHARLLVDNMLAPGRTYAIESLAIRPAQVSSGSGGNEG